MFEKKIRRKYWI